MRRSLALMILCLLLAGCGAKPAPVVPAQAPAPEPPAPVAPAQVPETGLLALHDPTTLTMDQLTEALARDLNEAGVPPVQRLAAIYQRWYQGLKPTVLEADLDGDGKTEFVTAIRMAGGMRPITGAGALFIIYKKGDRWAVDGSPGEEVVGAALHAVADLTGDSAPEIIWGETQAGAHTVHYSIFVSQWKPGVLSTLPGQIQMPYMQLNVDGRDLVLRGGLIGSAGAGAQRERTDRYRWMDGQFRLVDRAYTTDPLGYWRLVDGIVHEQFGRPAEAEKAYRDVLDPAREVAPAGMIKPEQAAILPDAVRTTARLRLAWLLMRQNRYPEAEPVIDGASGPYADLVHGLRLSSSIPGACNMAVGWTRSHPEFLQAMNGLFGYANEIWTAQTLCGNLP